MANDRLKLTIEFSRYDVKEVEAYSKLRNLSTPGNLIKDILMGRLPFEIIQTILGGTEDGREEA